MKIHIIGGSGTGKSTLARQLSEKYGGLHVDLDDLFWDNTADRYDVKMPEDKRAQLLNEVLEKSDWITEGVYYSWVGDCFQLADAIYLLDIPQKVCSYRIIKRFVRRKLHLERSKKESIWSLAKLLKWTEKFREKNLPEIYKALEPYSQKTIVIRNSKELRKILDRV